MKQIISSLTHYSMDISLRFIHTAVYVVLNRIKGCIILLIIFSGCVSSPVIYSNGKIFKKSSIAILPFIDYNINNNSGDLFTNIFSATFENNGFNVISQEKINHVINENKIIIKKLDITSVIKIGKTTNADYILTGAVTDYNSYSNKRKVIYIFEWLRITYTATVTARLINTKTGETLWIGSSSDQSSSFTDTGNNIVKDLYKTINFKEHVKAVKKE